MKTSALGRSIVTAFPLAHPARSRSTTTSGNAALGMAIPASDRNFIVLAELLYRRGEDGNGAADNGRLRARLFMLLRRGPEDKGFLLVAAGAYANGRSHHGTIALVLAVSGSYRCCAELLCQHGAIHPIRFAISAVSRQ